MFLADKSSPWYKGFPNFDKKFNIEDFQKDVDNIIAISESLTMQRAESQSSSEGEPWNLLGLKGFKVPNETKTVFNILQSTIPMDKKTVTAEFASDSTGTRVYAYARNVCGNVDRCEDDKKEVKEWLKTMPPEPKQPKQPKKSKEDKEAETKKKKGTGFPKGAAAKHFGEDNTQVLDRVFEKLLLVQRPSPDAYGETSVLKTDQEILDSLEAVPAFNNVFNSENVGKLLYMQSTDVYYMLYVLICTQIVYILYIA